jgi:hypothetical protein
MCQLQGAPLLNADTVLSRIESGLLHFKSVRKILADVAPLMATWPTDRIPDKGSLYNHRDHMGLSGAIRKAVDAGAEQMGRDLDQMTDHVITIMGITGGITVKGGADLAEGRMKVSAAELMRAAEMHFALERILKGQSSIETLRGQMELIMQAVEDVLPMELVPAWRVRAWPNTSTARWPLKNPVV